MPLLNLHAPTLKHLQNPGKAGHEMQSSTLELINGLVSLVHQQTMPDVAQEAMEALLVLHRADNIELWNPEAPIKTFWDVRCAGPSIKISIMIVRSLVLTVRR